MINIWVYSKIQKHSPEIEPTLSRHPLKKIMLEYDIIPRACRGVCLCTIIVLLYVLLLCDFQNIVLVSLEEQTRLLNEALHKCVLYILESESNSQNGKFLRENIWFCRRLLRGIFWEHFKLWYRSFQYWQIYIVSCIRFPRGPIIIFKFIFASSVNFSLVPYSMIINFFYVLILNFYTCT